MKHTLCAILLFLLFLPAFAQDNAGEELSEILIEGTYSGSNIYVLNPSQKEDFCVKKVTINGKPYTFANTSNAFEINLTSCELNEFVVVQIMHSPDCQPVIINKDKLKPITEFALSSFTYNKKTKLLTWSPKEMNEENNYELEQLLYGKWIKIKNLGSPSEMISDNYLPVLLSGMNYFRIKQIDKNNVTLFSSIVSIKSPNRHILLVSDKVKEAIEFTDVTHYELYDDNGFFLKRGTAKKINVTDLNKGNYWLNFDGKEIRITKK